MTDEWVGGVLREPGLRVLVATTGALARHARGLHGSKVTSAELLSQAMSASALMAGLQLQKGTSRVNLQLECDGPLRGLFADAGTDGTVRGYVKNPGVDIQGNLNPFRYRPALGNSGFLSVLRDLGNGEYYRSSVELGAMDLALDLERFFDASEQLPAAIALEVVPSSEEPLASVGGVLLQPLPEGDRDALLAERGRLRDQGVFRQALAHHPASAESLARALFDRPDFELTSRVSLRFACSCSLERVEDALLASGRQELESMLRDDKKAEVSCAFCARTYVVGEEGLRRLLEKVQVLS